MSIDSEVIQLGEKFWSWRRTQQPRSHDDITRIARNPKEKKVPMDNQTAREEAVFFSSCPGQALTYQIGKTQILKMYSDSVSKFGRSFEIKSFHNYLWLNGNVPISLLRFEY